MGVFFLSANSPSLPKETAGHTSLQKREVCVSKSRFSTTPNDLSTRRERTRRTRPHLFACISAAGVVAVLFFFFSWFAVRKMDPVSRHQSATWRKRRVAMILRQIDRCWEKRQTGMLTQRSSRPLAAGYLFPCVLLCSQTTSSARS